MALTTSSIAQLRESITMLEQSMNQAVDNMKYNRAQYSGNDTYQKWVAGTEFGSKYEENCSMLVSKADAIKQYSDQVLSQLRSFADRQESINNTGR